MGAADWRDRQAEAILVYHGTGTLVGDSWYEARIPLGGGSRPSQPVEREPKLMTPGELLEALRGPFGDH
jgi:hypothetical protein